MESKDIFPKQQLDYIVVLDFEATCNDGKDPPKPQEIIELPSVLIDTKTWNIIDEFDSFIHPTFNSILTPFCTELTSITQEQVDSAPIFIEVFMEHQKWLQSHGLPLERMKEENDDSRTCVRWTFVTCGDWDLASMLPSQLKCLGIKECPSCYTQWINIKFPFREIIPIEKTGMAGMLSKLELELTGHHHLGIDDCRNIAKIVKELAKRGKMYEITTKLAISRYPQISIDVQQKNNDEDPKHLVLKKRSLATLLGISSGAFKFKMTRAFITNTERELKSDDDLRFLINNTNITVTHLEDF